MSLLLVASARRHPARPTTYEQEVLRDGPLGYWRGFDADGVLRDFSGNGRDGAYNTTTFLVQRDVPLRAGAEASLRMNGNSYAASIGGGPLIDNVIGLPWAMEVIVKASVTGGGGVTQQIFSKDGTSTFGSSQSIYYRFNTLHGRQAANVDTISPNNTRGQVVHAIYECDGTSAYLYENGVLVATLARSENSFAPIMYLMGTLSFPGSYGFVGNASDFAIYDHALGPARALSHARAARLAP